MPPRLSYRLCIPYFIESQNILPLLVFVNTLRDDFYKLHHNVGLCSKPPGFKMEVMGFVSVGYGNVIAGNRVIGMVSPNSSPVKRAIQDGRNRGIVIDTTNGRKTRVAIFTDSGHIILAAISPETIAGRVLLLRD